MKKKSHLYYFDQNSWIQRRSFPMKLKVQKYIWHLLQIGAAIIESNFARYTRHFISESNKKGRVSLPKPLGWNSFSRSILIFLFIMSSSDQTMNLQILFQQYFSVEKVNKFLIGPKILFSLSWKIQNKYYVSNGDIHVPVYGV